VKAGARNAGNVAALGRRSGPERSEEAMVAEYERSRYIEAAVDDVFAFVSDPNNLPTFVPTLDSIEPRPDGRILARGTIHGQTYEDEGWLNVEEARRRLEWRVDVNNYAGWLSVSGDGAERTQVVIHLSVPPYVTPSGRPITGELAADAEPIEASLEAALDSLRNLMEGRGGKAAPAAFD
jgi:uncharacterized membrane protein